MKITVFGVDRRFVYAERLLASEGFETERPGVGRGLAPAAFASLNHIYPRIITQIYFANVRKTKKIKEKILMLFHLEMEMI